MAASIRPSLDSSPYGGLLRTLIPVERRVRLQEAAQGAPLAMAVGLGLATALAFTARLTPILPPAQVGIAAGVLLLAALGVRAAIAGLRPLSRLLIARRADAALALDEKVATAVDLHERSALPPPPAPILAAQLADATASLRAAVPDLPAHMSLAPARRSLIAPVLVAAVFAAVLLAPNPLQVYWEQQAAQHAQQQAEAAKIEQLRKDLQAKGDPADPTRQQLLAELDQLHHDLQAGDLSREQAMARLSAAEAKLQQQLDTRSPAEQAALDTLGRRLESQSSSPLHDAGKALQQGDTSKAADAIRKAGADAAKMAPQDRQALAQQLGEAAADAAANDPDLARKLDEAAQALQNGDPQAAQQALDNLANSVERTGQQLATQQDLNQALSQIQESRANLSNAAPLTAQNPNGTPGPGSPPNVQPTIPPAMQTAYAQLTVPPAMQTALAQGTMPPNITPLALTTPMAFGTISGTPGGQGQGTPILVPSTPGQGTPIAMPGQGQGTPIAGPGQGQGGQGQGQGTQGQGGQGQGQGQGQGTQGSGSGTAGGGAGNQHTEPVAVPPSTLNAQGTPVGVTARPNSGDTGVTGVNINPGNGPASVPYQDVYGTYNDAAQKNLNTTYIPAGMKDLVRRYFTSIEPDK